jgi:competence protein ComFC
MRSRIHKAGWKILDWFFPPSCAGCGEWGKKYCPECLKKTKLISNPICQLCGDPVPDPRIVICDRCNSSEVAFFAVRSWAYFEDPLQSAIHQLKYKQDIGLAGELARHLIGMLKKIGWQIDVVLGIPLDSVRRRERGYNQAALLAKPISWELGIKYQPEAVVRIKQTRTQVGLDRRERVENMAGAFQAREDLVSDATILLVDDVITTGSTMNACALSLLQSGAATVYGITLARSAHI